MLGLQKRPFAELFREASSITSWLAEEDDKTFGPMVELDRVIPLHNDAALLRAGTRLLPVTTKRDQMYRSDGFVDVPNGFSVVVVPTDGLTPVDVQPTLQALRKVMHERRITPLVRTLDVRAVRRRLDELDAAPESRIRPPDAMLLLLPRKEGGLSAETKSVLDRLDAHRVPWRRCYADDDKRWSVRDQLGSLLTAAGGTPFELVWPENIGPLWSIGFDLSHPVGSQSSTLCCTLVKPNGRLECAWTIAHRRDETINQASLKLILKAVQARLPNDARVLMIRDGRLFERELDQTYLHTLTNPCSLVELRKRGNPLLVTGSKEPLLPSQATAAVFDQRHIAFLVAHPEMTPTSGYPTVLKLTTRPSWDGLNLGLELLVSAVMHLTHAPSLGLAPSKLPAPIYWADGIAKASGERLNFRGQMHITLKPNPND